MIFFVVLLFVLCSPAIGIFLMEQGAFGPSIGRYGEPIGATVAYLAYLATLGLAMLLVLALFRPTHQRSIIDDAGFLSMALLGLAFNAIFLATMLLGFGGIEILRGDISKGAFRVNLGEFGAVAYMVTKYLSPAVLAYIVFAYRYRLAQATIAARTIVALNFAAVFVIGLTWGFKTTALTMILPAVLIFYWKRLTIGSILFLVAATAGVLLGTAFAFDDHYEFSQILDHLLLRATVIQGDVAWAIWEMQSRGYPWPDYLPTLGPVIGDGLFTQVTGLTREDRDAWIHTHYDLLLTFLMGNSPEHILDRGHTLTATPFAEGVVALGVPGFLLFGAIAGMLIAVNCRLIDRALTHDQAEVAALAATYFAFIMLPWINSGAIVQLFHISVWVSLGVSYALLRLLAAASTIKMVPLGIAHE
jgi:hypothetical protein